jgi:hypothetical protein
MLIIFGEKRGNSIDLDDLKHYKNMSITLQMLMLAFEAESTAFIVCSHYGIDTSDYSFGYLAAWSSGKELKELQGSLDTIQKQANDLIGRLDERLEVLQKERNPQRRETRAVRTSILDRLQTAKQAVTQRDNLGSLDLSQPAIETEAR